MINQEFDEHADRLFEKLAELIHVVELVHKESLESCRQRELIEDMVCKMAKEAVAETTESEYLALIAYVAAKSFYKAAYLQNNFELLESAKRADEAAKNAYELVVKLNKKNAFIDESVHQAIKR